MTTLPSEVKAALRKKLKNNYLVCKFMAKYRYTYHKEMKSDLVELIIAALQPEIERLVAEASKSKTFNDGIHDGQELMKFIAARIIDHERKQWGYNTNAARALNDVKKKIVEHGRGIICAG